MGLLDGDDHAGVPARERQSGPWREPSLMGTIYVEKLFP